MNIALFTDTYLPQRCGVGRGVDTCGARRALHVVINVAVIVMYDARGGR